MKKVLIALVCILLLVSCSEKKENLCYYGFFSDTAVMIAYNAEKDTVYDITLPYGKIVSWGIDNGIENIPNAIRSYIGAKDNSFLMGSHSTLDSLYCVSEAVASDIQSLKNPAILANINKLCSADLSSLAQSIGPKTSFVKSDASSFSGNRDYFSTWVRQIYGE